MCYICIYKNNNTFYKPKVYRNQNDRKLKMIKKLNGNYFIIEKYNWKPNRYQL